MRQVCVKMDPESLTQERGIGKSYAPISFATNPTPIKFLINIVTYDESCGCNKRYFENKQ